jgi:hypothetical protein
MHQSCDFWAKSTWHTDAGTREYQGLWEGFYSGSGVISALLDESAKSKSRFLLSVIVWEVAPDGEIAKEPCAMLNPDAKGPEGKLPVPVAKPNTDVRPTGLASIMKDADWLTDATRMPSHHYTVANWKEN